MADKMIVGVQFNPVGKVYAFSLSENEVVQAGDIVLVSTARGRQLGRVVKTNARKPLGAEEIQSIERIANEDDLIVWEENALKARSAVEKVRSFLRDPRYDGVKVLSADYSFDGNRLTLYLHYDPNQNFDIRTFIHDISHEFEDTHIEVRQIGPRDVARALSGLGACGIEKRCCSRFLTDFSSISIKMAKSQDISLTPMEITGMCGRLRCCLAFEYETYEEARKNLPKRKKVIQTPMGEGKVVQVLPLSNTVIVDIPEKGPRQFTLEELQTGVMSEKSNVPVAMPYFDFSDEENTEIFSLEEKSSITAPKEHRPPENVQRGRRGPQENPRQTGKSNQQWAKHPKENRQKSNFQQNTEALQERKFKHQEERNSSQGQERK